MAKVFTITEGLENLGALKSGGQGSVYKARRSGEIITAIKILPTPISSETDDDKNFASFQNEVQKLKKVNESPNPNVVSIIASGITTSGNLPYIEMEYIEGTDLGELLTPPYDPVFTIKETIKVADHLSNALAHCHRADIKHGDIKSNNVKFNRRTGNYMLLDFGLSIMSDEQRRTSIRHAGAIEFMAPEQNLGVMYFETDIYSLGIIFFELLTGTVPFPLHNKGEIGRNTVMLAHMESTLPDLLSLRRRAMPAWWSDEKKEREMQVPAWLIKMICRCLEKEPAKRFRNGIEIQEFIHSGITAEETKVVNNSTEQLTIARTHELQLKKHIQKLELLATEKDSLIEDLRIQVESKDKAIEKYAENYNSLKPKKTGISKSLFFIVLLIALGVGGFTTYDSFIRPVKRNLSDTSIAQTQKPINPIDSSTIADHRAVRKARIKLKKNIALPVSNTGKEQPGQLPVDGKKATDNKPAAAKQYRVINNAYFYITPDAHTRRNTYVIPGEETVTAINDKNGFVFVTFIDSEGKTTRGWLSKKDLSEVNEY
ncbi:MAG: serine/threonine-protein kinase [Ginsengibacter sp.]